FARMISKFVSRPVRVSNYNMQVWLVEGKVVVASIPNYNVGFVFGFDQDSIVVDPRINCVIAQDVGLVLLSFLYCTSILVQILKRSKALNRLSRKITIRHGMPN